MSQSRSSRPRPSPTNKSPPPHRRKRSENDNDEHPHATSGATCRRAAQRAARQLRHGERAEQADRDQPQRHDQAGGAGAAAARRRAADQPEPASLPAEEAMMRALLAITLLALAPAAAAQTPAVNAA